MEKQLGRNVTLDEAKLAISKQELQQLEKQAKAEQRVSRLVETIKETFINGLVQSGVLEKIKSMPVPMNEPNARYEVAAVDCFGRGLHQLKVNMNTRNMSSVTPHLLHLVVQ